MAFRITRRPASKDRVPALESGEAIIYTRYDDEKTVAMNPDDFHRFAELDADLTEIAADQRLPLSDLALEAVRAEATAGEAIEDPAEIEAILGL
jgi:hypothetical protein